MAVDVAAEAASHRYFEAEVRLRIAAREADETQRPTLATQLRLKAAWCHRAAVAEEKNPEPRL